MKGVNPQGTYRHRVPTLTLMGLALHGPAWAGGPHTHTHSNIITGLGLQPVAGWFFIAVEHFVGLQLLS
jgi:hypothetical protein